MLIESSCYWVHPSGWGSVAPNWHSYDHKVIANATATLAARIVAAEKAISNPLNDDQDGKTIRHGDSRLEAVASSCASNAVGCIGALSLSMLGLTVGMICIAKAKTSRGQPRGSFRGWYTELPKQFPFSASEENHVGYGGVASNLSNEDESG